MIIIIIIIIITGLYVNEQIADYLYLTRTRQRILSFQTLRCSS